MLLCDGCQGDLSRMWNEPFLAKTSPKYVNVWWHASLLSWYLSTAVVTQLVPVCWCHYSAGTSLLVSVIYCVDTMRWFSCNTSRVSVCLAGWLSVMSVWLSVMSGLLSVWLSVCHVLLSVWLSVCHVWLAVWLSGWLSVMSGWLAVMSVCLSVMSGWLSGWLSVCHVCLSVCLSVMSGWLSVWLAVCLAGCLSVMSVCLSGWLSETWTENLIKLNCFGLYLWTCYINVC